MFTGLIQEKAVITEIVAGSGGLNLKLSKPQLWNDLAVGESICVDGVCLTLTKSDSSILAFFVGGETLSKSTFPKAQVQRVVNLERSLRMGDRLGGHMVTGHVDGIATVTESQRDGDCLRVRIQVSPQQYKWIITKGSIALNGVSLTVNDMNRELRVIEVYLIPETLSRTNLASLKVGDELNVECDQTVKIIAQQVSLYGVHNEQHS